MGLQMHANDRTEIKSAVAGDIIAIVGLKQTTTGETLCDRNSACILEKMDFPEPSIRLLLNQRLRLISKKCLKHLSNLQLKILHSDFLVMKKLDKLLLKVWENFTLKLLSTV